MKLKIAAAIMMMTTPAISKEAVISCFAKNGNGHVVVVEDSNGSRIQWDGGPFHHAITRTDADRYLIIEQFGNIGTFRLIYDPITLSAYGGTNFYSGKKWESVFYCTFQ